VRRPVAIVVVIASAALLVGGVVVADVVARQLVGNYVSEKVHEALSLDPAEPVEVTIGGTSMLAQLISGRIERVDVSVDSVTIGDLTGSVTVQADGIPTDTSKTVDAVAIELHVSEADVQKATKALSGATVDSVIFVGGELQLSSTLSFFGLSVDIGLTVDPTVRDGVIDFTPTGVSLNGATTSTESLAQTFGPLAAPLTASRSVCVAQWLPKDLSLTSVTIVGKELVVAIDGSAVRLDDAALQELGSCA
jgi:hypothetical protein